MEETESISPKEEAELNKLMSLQGQIGDMPNLRQYRKYYVKGN
jgi:hypothetical protein